MALPSALCLLCGLMLYTSLTACNSTLALNIPTHHNGLKSFREDGVFDYSTMLIREDLNVLLLGATDAIFALDLNNISVKYTAVYWAAKEHPERPCRKEMTCRNHIRTLQQFNETTMYVCGTHALSPRCTYMTFVDGQLMLEGEKEQANFKCPFDPIQKFASLIVGRDIFSALSNYFYKETVPVHISVKRNVLFLNRFTDPTFVHLEFVPESLESRDGDDDKIYLFFSENSEGSIGKVAVSQVARVCKGDLGSKTRVKNTWTSLLKARLACSLGEASLPPVVQDVILLKNDNWRNSVFYAVFTTPSRSSKKSFVCAYNVSAIREVFDEGRFKTSDGRSVVPDEEVPVPRPGACINNVARSMGIMSSLDLPASSLEFIKNHPLMDEAVQPMTGRPLLIVEGPFLTQIVVDRVMALDGQNYSVMFVGTENGFVKKAVNYDGQMFIIEEIQLYEELVPVTTLRLSESKGQIYAGSQFGAVQMPVSNCSRYTTCVDCVLAKDPYCAWDLATKQCSLVTGVSNTAVQSLKEGDCTRCPPLDDVKVLSHVLVPGNNIQLPCQAHSNLSKVYWRHSGKIIGPDDKYNFSDRGLVIVNAAKSDAGLYVCDSVAETTGRIYNRTEVIYRLELPPEHTTTAPTIAAPTANTKKSDKKTLSNLNNCNHLVQQQNVTVTILLAAVIVLSLAFVTLAAAFIWKCRRGRFHQSSTAAQSADTQNTSTIEGCHRLIGKDLVVDRMEDGDKQMRGADSIEETEI